MTNEVLEATTTPSEILHPGSRALFRYWEGLRGERAAPERVDLDLFKIRDLVPNIFILERHPVRQAYKWRLAGTKVCSIWRQELTGKDVFQNWHAFERDLALRLLDGVVGSFQPCVIRLRLQTSLNHPIPVEMVCLPLRAYSGAAFHALGAIMPFSETNTMGYDSIARIELLSARAIWTEPLPGDPLSGPGQSIARPFSNFRVIEGGRSGSPY